MSIAFPLLSSGLGLWIGLGAGVGLMKFWRDTRTERLAAQLDEERAHIVALAQSLSAHRTQLLNTGAASAWPPSLTAGHCPPPDHQLKAAGQSRRRRGGRSKAMW